MIILITVLFLIVIYQQIRIEKLVKTISALQRAETIQNHINRMWAEHIVGEENGKQNRN